MNILLLVFITSFFVVLLTIPALIRVALLKRLFDEPDEVRKLHTRRVPTVGGIMIFAGTLFSFALWFPIGEITDYSLVLRATNELKFLIAGMLILFFVGVKDDIIGTAPIKKLLAHVIVGLMLVLMAEIRLTSLHGLFSVFEIPLWASIFVSLFTYIVVVNAFNLIDGIDGLAGGVGLIACSAFGTWFIFAGDFVMASLAFALAGSLMAFLIFNFSPAKIFMGDSGSLVIGFTIAVLGMELIEYKKTDLEGVVNEISKPVFAMSVLVYPLYDTLRVFIVRSVRGLSPFTADRNHIHHRLQDNGLNHKQISVCIYIATLFVITVSILTRNLDPSLCFAITAASAVVLAQIPFIYKKRNVHHSNGHKKQHVQKLNEL